MDESCLQTVYRAGTAKPPVFEAINGDEVWLIKNPALYYPLDNQEARQRHSPKEAVNPTVCLWKAEIKCHPKSLVIKDHPKFKGVYVVKGRQNVLKKFVRSLSWEKSSVPQCQGGMTWMDFNVIGQAVLYYMVANPPTTPEDFNSHAELKAASHWYWPKDDEPKQPASGPHDDLRIKKVAAIALKSWKEELCQAQKQAVKRKQGLPVKAGRNDEKTDSSDDLDEYISDLEEIIFSLRMYYKGTLEETDDDNSPSIDTVTLHEDDRSSKIGKHVSPRRCPRRSPRRKRKRREDDDTFLAGKRSRQSPSPPTHDERMPIAAH